MATKKAASIVLFALGEQIKKQRAEKGLSQTRLAEICGMEKSSLSKIESGLVNVSFLSLLKISKALEVSLEALVK